MSGWAPAASALARARRGDIGGVIAHRVALSVGAQLRAVAKTLSRADEALPRARARDREHRPLGGAHLGVSRAPRAGPGAVPRHARTAGDALERDLLRLRPDERRRLVARDRDWPFARPARLPRRDD